MYVLSLYRAQGNLQHQQLRLQPSCSVSVRAFHMLVSCIGYIMFIGYITALLQCLKLKQPKLCQRGLQYHRLFVAMDDVVDLIMKSFLKQIITESGYAFMKPSFI